MAMNATLDSSKANRRFIILAVVLGLLGAILVYVAFSRDTSPDGGNGLSGATAAVVVAKADIAARTKVTPDMLEVKVVPQDTVSEFTYADPAQVVGQVTRFPIAANQQILSSQVINTAGTNATSRALSYTIPKDKRAMAITANSVQNAGGLILPGDYVDVMVIYGGGDGALLVQTLMQNVEILAVSQTIVDLVGDAKVENGQRVRNTEAKPLPDAGTVTVLVTPEQAQTLFLAGANGELRLTLRAYGDGTEKPLEFLTLPDLLPGN